MRDAVRDGQVRMQTKENMAGTRLRRRALELVRAEGARVIRGFWPTCLRNNVFNVLFEAYTGARVYVHAGKFVVGAGQNIGVGIVAGLAPRRSRCRLIY